MIMTEEEIFQNDLIGDRRNLAERTASLVEQEGKNSKGFVLAINGEWGTGKTTFVKMLVPYLEEIKKYKVINFNCWKRDFVEDPLIAMFAELSEVVGKDDDKYKKARAAFGKIAIGVIAGAAKGFIGPASDVLHEAFKGGVEAAGKCGESYLDKYQEQSKSYLDFEAALSEYVASCCEKSTKVVFIIDELDRCNPHYAVKVLERIKHLFDIPNLFFILPICKSQLECAIKGYYGSENIDANNYLRRFIDLEIKLPVVNLENYCEKIIINSGVIGHISDINNNFNSERLRIYKISTALFFECTNTDLRSIEKILCHVDKVMIGRYWYDMYYPILLLCYLKFNESYLYDKISGDDLTLDEMLSEFEKLFIGYSINRASENLFCCLILMVASLLYTCARRDKNMKTELQLNWSEPDVKQNTIYFNKNKIAEKCIYFDNCQYFSNVSKKDLIRHINNPLEYEY